MPRRATLRFVSLKSCLVNLPISMYGPLVEHRVRPQSLAVHLSPVSGPAKSAHVGWTGMASASSLAQWQARSSSDGALETVEMDPQFATSLELSEGMIVEIGLLYDLPVAKSIAIEPFTSDDWEILQLHADFVEENFLSQVRVASIGQEVDIWVLGRTRIRFRIEAITPKRQVSLLGGDTEVAVAPKSRKKAAAAQASTSIAQPVEPPPSVTSTSHVLRVLPSYLLDTSAHKETTSAVVLLSPDTYEDVLGVPNSVQKPPQPADRYANVRPLAQPTERKVPANSASMSQSSGQTRVLKTGKAHDGTVNEESTAQTETAFLMRRDPAIPPGQAVILGDTDFHDWDVVSIRAAPAPSPTHSKNGVNGKVNGTSSKASTHASHPPSRHPAELAGVEPLLTRAHGTLLRSMSSSSHNIPHSGVLIGGNPGSGRTAVAREVARRLSEDPSAFAYTVFLDLAKHTDVRIPTLRTSLQECVDEANWHKPSLLVIDNLDKVVSAEVEHADPTRARTAAEAFVSLFGPGSLPREVGLLATCGGAHAVHSLLTESHIFGTYLAIPTPDQKARQEILSKAIQRKLGRHTEADVLNLAALSAQSEGYSASDLQDWVARAIHQSVVRSKMATPSLIPADFTAAQVDFTPLALRDVKLQSSKVEWADIGGLHETRRTLRETLEWPTKYAAIFAKCPLRLRSGLLLYGYPGCGKTLLASAVAKECDLNFISVKGPELLNKYIGASEQSVRDLFDRASSAKPCVLFFDEFDSIAPKRGHDSTGVTDRVVNQLLTLMDGAEGLDGVYVLAATSRPDLIDPALLRPGRLDKSLICDIPTEAERAEILRALSRKVSFSSSVDLDEVARRTEGFTGADLQALVYNAHLEAVHGVLQEKTTAGSTAEKDQTVQRIEYAELGRRGTGTSVTSAAESSAISSRLAIISRSRREVARRSADVVSHPRTEILDEHVQKSLESARPSLSAQERHRLTRIYRNFIADRSGALPVPPEAGGVGHRVSLM